MKLFLLLPQPYGIVCRTNRGVLLRMRKLHLQKLTLMGVARLYLHTKFAGCVLQLQGGLHIGLQQQWLLCWIDRD